MLDALKAFFARPVAAPIDITLWHKARAPFWPRITIDGQQTRAAGQVWQRCVDGKWEYRLPDDDYENWLSDQW